MQALILAGGEGTRLRPLTSTVPKPVVPLVDRPFAAYMLEWLGAHGIDDVIMSCGFLAAGVRNVLGDGSRYGIRLRYIEEPRPLGTGGAVKFAESLLDERFLMLNGDILTDLDLTSELDQHAATGARCTLALVEVDDPSGYGLVQLDETDAVTHFLEKPAADQTLESRWISAGAYVVERDVLSLMAEGRATSIEREVFPQLIGAGLYGYRGSGYWLDIGTPERYLRATFDILERDVRTLAGEQLGPSFMRVADGVENAGRIVPPAVVRTGCRIARDARVGGLAVLGQNVQVGEGSVIERSVVLDGARVASNCTLRGCIVGAGARIGDHSQISGGAVLGEGVTIGADNVLDGGARIFPGVMLPDRAIQF